MLLTLMLLFVMHPCKEDSLRQVLAQYQHHHHHAVSQRATRTRGRMNAGGGRTASHPARCDTVYVVREVERRMPSAGCPVTARYGRVAPESDTPLLGALLQGFELTAGFRWQTEPACTSCGVQPEPRACTPTPPQHQEVKDPFYVGAALHLPLSERLSVNGEFDRDWVEAAHWQTRAWLGWRPWGR